jgi:hypothetical protein
MRQCLKTRIVHFESKYFGKNFRTQETRCPFQIFTYLKLNCRTA